MAQTADVKGMRNRWEDIFYSCEWLNCNAVYDSDEAFYDHVLQHVQEVIDKPCEERGGEPAPTCLWCSCVVEADSQYIMRHLYYHAFHTKLMARGGHLAQINKWPACRADSSNRVVIPIIPGPFVCGWRLCDFQANNVDIFYAHVEGHPQEYRNGQHSSEQIFSCQWDDCSHRSGRITHLVVHLASHTRKRCLACRHCGDMFVSSDKLREHLLRQAMMVDSREEHVKSGVTEHACLQCGRVYASERMLRDHLRRHVNVLKCQHCEMTCSSKYALKRHITYKHMEARPFVCELCPYSAKSSSDLVQHVQVSHENVRTPMLCCSQCRYTCKRMNSMIKHERLAHPNAEDSAKAGPSNASTRATGRPPYACHLCKKRYQRGCKLSGHLRTKHNLRLPPGFSKFTYQLCEDGCRRLQTTRVDSLEVIQQILGVNEVERLLASEQAGSSEAQPEESTETPETEAIAASEAESDQGSCLVINLQVNQGSVQSRDENAEVICISGDENPV